MIQNEITLFPLSSIQINRSARQRSDIPRILELALDIAQSQWINPILIDKASSQLIAGERRYSAVTLLHQAALCLLPENFLKEAPVEQLNQLRATCECKVASLENWSRIPAQLGTNITPIELLTFEFKENVAREDLSWQDRAKAIYQIHNASLADPAWTIAHTSRLLNLDYSTVKDSLQAWRAVTSGDPKLARIVQEAPGLNPAILAIRRVTDRRDGPLLLNVAPQPVSKATAAQTRQFDPPIHATADTEVEAPATHSSLGSCSIICADFLTWASSYSGPPFNFIHLDPPYGINFNKGGRSGGQNSAIDTRMLGEYDDSEEAFWSILETLIQHNEKLIAPSAHLMLWYSQNYDLETMRFLDRFIFGKQWTHRLIWHCSDNAGLCPDPQRSGRRTYETAFVLSFGDRLIAHPKALSFSRPRENSVHRSQKPLAVLSHFFQMFVDDTSLVLDPTCGSGTALIAAHRLGAKQVLGLEIDPETRERAVKYFDEETARGEIK